MAEGRRLERPRVSRRDLGLAGRCITSLPAFRDLRMVARGGFEPPTFTAWVTALQAAALAAMRPRHRMVGQVGVEPTKSPRSERGAFTSLTTARWWAGRDSNSHGATFEIAASACCATGPRVAEREGLEPPTEWLRHGSFRDRWPTSWPNAPRN
jgi:hypothetical protein